MKCNYMKRVVFKLLNTNLRLNKQVSLTIWSRRSQTTVRTERIIRTIIVKYLLSDHNIASQCSQCVSKHLMRRLKILNLFYNFNSNTTFNFSCIIVL